MKQTIKTKDMVLTALLIAIGIIIPMIFTGLPFRWEFGAFSMTLMAHVPVIIAMFISPMTALFTALGTTIGFFFTAPFIIAVRAASHIIFAFLGTYLLKKQVNLFSVSLFTGIVHSFFEGVVVMFFYLGNLAAPEVGYSISTMVIITIVGTFIHHMIDFILAVTVGKALTKAKFLPPLPPVWKKK